MTDEQKKNEQRILPWRFWFSAVLTCVLIITFALYLPMRFQYHALTQSHAAMANGAMSGMSMTTTYYQAADIKEGLSVDLSLPYGQFAVGTTTELQFLVSQKPEHTSVQVGELQAEHTKLMHVIGIRDDMNEFFHIHPQPEGTSSIFTIAYTFPKPGRYKIWSEIKKDAVNYSFGQEPITVAGVGSTGDGIVPVFADAVTINGYEVHFHHDSPIIQNQPAGLSFLIHTPSGGEAVVEPYLGADMHLTIIKSDLSVSIHAHPEGAGHMDHMNSLIPFFVPTAHAHGDEEGAPAAPVSDNLPGIPFHISFPSAGLYKAFAKFRPQGINLPSDEALVASFWLKVEDHAPPSPAPKAALVIISLGLIALLGWGVRRFLRVTA